MNKKVLVPVITIPVVSLLAVAFYLVKRMKINQIELQNEIDNIGVEDISR